MTSVGVDVGTSVVKAVRFADDLTPEATASVGTTVSHPHPGWAELDPVEVSAAVEQVIAEIATPAVDLIAVTAQGDGCWLVDSAGNAARPAMLWNDARAAGIVDRWQAEGLLDDVFRTTGSYGNSGLANAQLAWLASYEPQVLTAADTLLSAGSWVWLQLTGQRALHSSDACNPLLSAVSGEYDLGLLERLGLGWASPVAAAGPRQPGRRAAA